MNIIKAISTLVFIFIASVANSGIKTGENAISNYKLYSNIVRSNPAKEEDFNKGEYVIKNEGQCKDSKQESFECVVLNIDKTMENRKKNNEPSLWIEIGCGYGFTDLPTKDLEKVVINRIGYYEYEGNSYVIVNQDRYYENIKREFYLELTLKVTGEGDNINLDSGLVGLNGGYNSIMLDLVTTAKVADIALAVFYELEIKQKKQ